MKQVYLDYHSTTPCDERVVKAMAPFWSECFGNPSAPHCVGEDAREAVEEARYQVAKLINAPPECIYFTSGATAANNILLQGLLLKARRILGPYKDVDVITTKVEHKSVLECVKEMRYRDEFYHHTHYLEVNNEGQLDLEKLDKILAKSLDTLVVSVMAANNEIGTIYDIEKIGQLCKQHDVFFHTDATQAIGKVKIDVEKMNIDALSMSAHKIYGPKGIGVLYMQNSNKILPLINGGYQETITSGTLNVPAIVGMGESCRIINEEGLEEENDRTGKLRDELLGRIISKIDGVSINGTMKNRLPNNLNLTIKGIKAEALVLGLDDVVVSSGSACNSGNPKPSHVLEALGQKELDCAIRLSVGRFTTEEDVVYASNRIIETIDAIRSDNA